MISDRQLKILKAIINDFIDTAQPVGSRTISKKYLLGTSSATIRNEMADLEELGYLLQPHTSAGRIPSDLGYRLYVDMLSDDGRIGTRQRQLIQSLLMNRIIEAGDIAKQSAQLLSEFTELTALVSVPKFSKCRLANLKLVKVSDTKVMLILVTDTGIVKNIQLALNDTEQPVLDTIAETMLQYLYGETIERIDVRAIGRIKEKLNPVGDVVDYLIPILRDALKHLEGTDFYVDGIAHLLSTREFSDTERAKDLFDYLRDEANLEALIETLPAEKLTIRIGSEIGLEALNTCSIVSASYAVEGTNSGKIIVLGPKRMDYGGVISIVNYVCNTLSDVFSGIIL